jgi:hypothetical protein
LLPQEFGIDAACGVSTQLGAGESVPAEFAL